MIMSVMSFALVKFYAFAILYELIAMRIKLVVVVVYHFENIPQTHKVFKYKNIQIFKYI